MEHLSGLLRACLDSPHDPSRRLILADYLEDHGEGERAELIRIQEYVTPDDCLDSILTVARAHRKRIARNKRRDELTALTLPPLPRPADAPTLAEVLRAWCGVWPHEDDSLREFICWWLAAVEWDHGRAGKVRGFHFGIERDIEHRPWGVYDGNEFNPFLGGTLPMPAAVRDLKRRVLGLFPEVEWTNSKRIRLAEWDERYGRSYRDARDNARQDGFRPDKLIDTEPTLNDSCIALRQILAAPDWIAPEATDGELIEGTTLQRFAQLVWPGEAIQEAEVTLSLPSDDQSAP